jgi:uncharacterized protein YegL
MAKKRRKSKFFFHSSKGNITFKILIGIVILGSIAMVSGIFPKNQITPMDPNAPKYKVKAEDGTIQKDSIQLKTLKFEACSESVAVEMVLDRSNSMSGKKIKDLKRTSLFFINKLTSQAPIGLVIFGTGAEEKFQIQPYGDIQGNIESIINGLEAKGITHTKDGMIKAKLALEVGMPKFPGRQFSLVLVTDGEPNPPDEQDPVATSNEIKNMGVKVYVIAITQDTNKQKMINLMKQVASPDGFFEASTTDQLQAVYDQIGFQICKEA